MKAIIYYRVSDQGQITQNARYMNKNGNSFIVCGRCDGEWIIRTLSKEDLSKRKQYPKPKCPNCD